MITTILSQRLKKGQSQKRDSFARMVSTSNISLALAAQVGLEAASFSRVRHHLSQTNRRRVGNSRISLTRNLPYASALLRRMPLLLLLISPILQPLKAQNIPRRRDRIGCGQENGPEVL